MLHDEAYWRPVINFVVLQAYGMIQPDLDLFRYPDTAEDAWAQLLAAGLGPGAPNPDRLP